MLLFTDSFENYTRVDDKWTTQRGSTGVVLTTAAGRFGLGWDMNSRYLTKNFTANYSTLIMGFALKPGAGFGSNCMAAFLSGGARTDSQVELRFNQLTGQWFVTRSGTQIGGAAFSPVSVGNFAYIEWKSNFSTTVGAVTVRVNGVTILNLTGQNTVGQGGTTANGILLGSVDDVANTGTVFDDVYLLDDVSSGVSGAFNNDFLGDVRIESRLPDGDGASSQLLGSDGNSVNNSLLVDEPTAPNGDTDYVESLTLGNKDTYTFQDLVSTSGSIYGVGIYPYAKKTDAGSRSIKTISRLSTTEMDGPERQLGSGYTYLPDYRDGDPTGAQWTIANFNAAQFGVKVFA